MAAYRQQQWLSLEHLLDLSIPPYQIVSFALCIKQLATVLIE